VAAGDWSRGGQVLNVIRRIMVTNLVLGLLTTVIGMGGRYF